MPSIQTVLQKAYHLLATESAQLEAEILLCFVLNKQRSFLRAWPEQPLTQHQAEQFWALVAQRQQDYPIAYITGQQEFWSRNFTVTPDVLIPRADTETLIECALTLLPTNQPSKVIDLGTGSGIIAITLAKERPLLDISATDISLAALAVAQDNANQHDVNHIRFYQSDWFSQVNDGGFDLIVSNPPYIAENDTHLHALRFEPSLALTAAQQGLAAINTLIDQARHYLQKGKHLLIEHGYNQQQATQQLFQTYGYTNITTLTDLSGTPRVTWGTMT